MDPNTAVTQASLRVAGLIYDTLIDYDANDRLAPGIAKSWSLSDDGLTYTFNLQPNAKFSDGSPITATDVQFSLQRSAKGARAWTAIVDRQVGRRRRSDDRQSHVVETFARLS